MSEVAAGKSVEICETKGAVYKVSDGLECAAGKLIPNHLYDRNMDELPIDKDFQTWPEVAEHIGPENLKLVARLQTLHDNDPED